MKTKKIAAITLGLILILSLSVTAFAAGTKGSGKKVNLKSTTTVSKNSTNVSKSSTNVSKSSTNVSGDNVCPYNEDCPYGEQCLNNGICLYDGVCPNNGSGYMRCRR